MAACAIIMSWVYEFSLWAWGYEHEAMSWSYVLRIVTRTGDQGFWKETLCNQ